MAKHDRPKKPKAVPGPVGNSKTPRSADAAPVGKQPRELPYDRGAVMGRTVVWRFHGLDQDGRWSIANVEGSKLVEVLVKLGSFEQQTIRELFYDGEEPGKHYDVEDLPKDSHDRLVQLGREDETKIARLRLTGAQRLYGFLREHVFHVLWWDPQHEVYPSKKRNT